MASQEHSLERQSTLNSSGQATGVDFEVAESLLQHSRGGRNGAGENMPIATQDYSTQFSQSNEDFRVGDGMSEHEHEHGDGERQTSSQERQSDAQYAPISNPPAFGQVCRSASLS